MKTAANLPPSDEPLAAATSAALVSNAEETASNVKAYPRPLHLNQTNPTHVKVIIHQRLQSLPAEVCLRTAIVTKRRAFPSGVVFSQQGREF